MWQTDIRQKHRLIN